MKTHIKFIKSHFSYCDDGLAYAEQFNSASEAWLACKRGDWMLWVLRKTNKFTEDQAIQLGAACANSILDKWEKRTDSNVSHRDAAIVAKRCIKSLSRDNAKLLFNIAALLGNAARDARCAVKASSSSVYAILYATDFAANSCKASGVRFSQKTAEPEWEWLAEKIREIVGNPFHNFNFE